jgi:hypothetical protein
MSENMDDHLYLRKVDGKWEEVNGDSHYQRVMKSDIVMFLPMSSVIKNRYYQNVGTLLPDKFW